MWKKYFLLFYIFSLVKVTSVIAGGDARFTDSIEKLVQQTPGQKKKVELLLAATKLLKSTDPDQAIVFASRALSLSANANYLELQLQAMIDLGNLYAIKTQFTQGMEMALKAKELAVGLDNKKALGETLLLIGMIRIYHGDYIQSYGSHFTALRLFEQVSDEEGIVKTMNGIGNICYCQLNFNKAFIYYTNALKRAREIHDSIQIANVLNNIGLVLKERGQMRNSIECFNEAIEINDRLGLKVRLAANYINIATLYLRLDRLNDFLVNYNKGILILSSIGSMHNLAMSYILYTDYFKALKDTENLRKYARMAYSDGLSYKLRDVVFQAAGILHKHYLSTGKIDSAYKYAMIQHAEKDTMDNEQSSARLTFLEMEYQDDKKQKVEDLKQQRNNFNVIIMVILAISGLLTTILFLSRQIVKTKNIRLEKRLLSDEVEFKNKELTISVMNLIKKNELNEDLSTRLTQMEQKVIDPDIKNEIFQLINLLQRNIKNEIWEEFEVRFRQVYNSFYEDLISRFPDLTSNELKICALLRLNLSTKEICELSGQRPSSLDMARYRLRKKLGLANSQTSLVTFLSQI